jgi:glutamate-1-semialdehyde aminotransferase
MLMSGLGEVLHDAGIPNHVLGHPSMFGLALGVESKPTDYRSYTESDMHQYERIMTALVQRGVIPDLDGREPWFLSYSHTEKDIAHTLEMFEEAVKEVKG